MNGMSDLYRILVVDDEPDVEPMVLQRMRREIRRGKYEFQFAGNGVQALERLKDCGDFDIVLSDINMPEMDGLTLLQQIPSVDPNIKSVIISAYGDMENIRAAMNRGAFDFVTKPIDFEDLRITIDRTVRHLEMWRDALASRDKLISIQNELGLANGMQQSILPAKFPEGDRFKIHGIMEPARNVGGDFFDIVRLDADRYGLAIADVSDKGVPAALFMMSSRTLLKGAAVGTLDSSKVLNEVNNLLIEDNRTGMFVTLLYGIFDPQTGEFEYSNGGHNPPLLARANGTAEYLEMPEGIALGLFSEIPFGMKKIRLEPGDVLILYTDGVTEAMNEDGELFGEERFAKVVSEMDRSDLTDLNKQIIQAIGEFAGGAAQSDDITCLSILYDGAS